jgi:tetratricopeptide (TPR) repeat protein
VLAKAAVLLHGDLTHERLDRAIYPAVTVRSNLASAFAELGEFSHALATAEESLQVAQVLQQPGSLVLAQGSIGTVLLRQGYFYDAVAPLEQAVALCNAHALVFWYSSLTGRLGYAYAMTGRHTEAMPLLEQAVERVQSPDAIVYLYLAEAYLRTGRHHDAGTVARRALALCREHGMRGIEARAGWILGEIATYHDSLAAAETSYRQALTLADELGMRPLQAHCHHGLGRLYAQSGQREKACGALSTAIDLYRIMKMHFWLPEAKAALAGVEYRC